MQPARAVRAQFQRLLDIGRPRRAGHQHDVARHGADLAAQQIPRLLIGADDARCAQQDDLGIRQQVKRRRTLRRRGQHQRAGLGDANECVLQAHHVGRLRAPLAQAQQWPRRPRDGTQVRMRRHHDVGRQVLRGEIRGHRLGHGIEIGHARDGAELPGHAGGEQRDLLGMGHAAARGDQMPRMRGKPPAQHRNLVRRQRPTTQPAPYRGEHRIPAHVWFRAQARPSSVITVSGLHVARVRSERRTCRPQVRAGRVRRSSRRQMAAS